MARSINSPGVQIVEKDISQFQQVVGGTTVFVPGFASQGPTDEVLLVTSISEFEQIYGTPQTAAERYFYHTSKQILNSPATLLTTRLPYGSGSGEGFADQYSALLYPAASAENTVVLGTPEYITLTEQEYEDILAKNFTWGAIPLTGSNPTPTFASNVLNAGLIIINKSKTAANELFEGYYVTVTDNSEWGLNSNFTAVNTFYALSSTTGLMPVPKGRFNFALSATNDLKGTESVSEQIEKNYTYDVGQPYYNDSLVVSLFKVRRSVYEPQDLTIQPVESYLGSLQPNKFTIGQNAGGETFFLETIVNNNSPNLQLLINPSITEDLNWVNQTSEVDEPNYIIRTNDTVKALFPNSVYIPTFETALKKEIGAGYAKIKRGLTLIESVESLLIDIIVDAGLSTIITNTPTVSGGTFVESRFTVGENLSSGSDPSVQNYRTITSLFNSFVKNTRQDCVFIADPLRQIFVKGENSKILDFKTNTFTQNIYQPLKICFENLNSNYSITYGNWVKGYDKFKDTNVWLPFSGFAAAAFARTDTNAQPWIAPAGLTRGIINDVVDLAFNPNQKQRDFLYTISINPVVFFANDGYAIFGQKTLQKKPSAFDRINVRRLFLTLERATQTALKYFVFEPNTEFTRTRLKNTITPILELAKNTDGVFDYLVVCDDRNNTSDIVDRNEIAVDIYIKPVKAAEFILVNFIATRTGQNFQELI